MVMVKQPISKGSVKDPPLLSGLIPSMCVSLSDAESKLFISPFSPLKLPRREVEEQADRAELITGPLLKPYTLLESWAVRLVSHVAHWCHFYQIMKKSILWKERPQFQPGLRNRIRLSSSTQTTRLIVWVSFKQCHSNAKINRGLIQILAAGKHNRANLEHLDLFCSLFLLHKESHNTQVLGLDCRHASSQTLLLLL